MDTQVITQIIVALVSGGFLTTVVQSVAQKASGRAERRRQDNKDLAAQVAAADARVDTAEAREDWERRARIAWETYAAQLRVACISHGYTPDPPPDITQLGPKP